MLRKFLLQYLCLTRSTSTRESTNNRRVTKFRQGYWEELVCTNYNTKPKPEIMFGKSIVKRMRVNQPLHERIWYQVSSCNVFCICLKLDTVYYTKDGETLITFKFLRDCHSHLQSIWSVTPSKNPTRRNHRTFTEKRDINGTERHHESQVDEWIKRALTNRREQQCNWLKSFDLSWLTCFVPRIFQGFFLFPIRRVTVISSPLNPVPFDVARDLVFLTWKEHKNT